MRMFILSGSIKFKLDNQRTMVLASGVISGDASSSFEATGFGLPFHLRGEHNPTTGGCNAVGCKHKRRRQGAIAQCSYCEHAYHACCLSPNDRSAALESSTISMK